MTWRLEREAVTRPRRSGGSRPMRAGVAVSLPQEAFMPDELVPSNRRDVLHAISQALLACRYEPPKRRKSTWTRGLSGGRGDSCLVGEDADDVAAALNLLVQHRSAAGGVARR